MKAPPFAHQWGGPGWAIAATALAVLAACDAPSSGAGVAPVPDAAGAAAAIASAGPAGSAQATSGPGASSNVPPAAPAAPEPPPTSVAAQHILIAYRGAKGAPKGVTRSKADARKRADELLAKIRAGADFTDMVKAYTDDPGSADRLGSVGKFTRDKMDKSFSDAAFGLKVDEVSGVVESPFGFHIIKRNQ